MLLYAKNGIQTISRLSMHLQNDRVIQICEDYVTSKTGEKIPGKRSRLSCGCFR